MTNQLLIAIGIMLILSFILQNSSKKKSKKKQEAKKPNSDSILQEPADEIYPYKDKYMLTKNEYTFYLELQKLAKEMNWIICPKVGLKELFEVTNQDNYMHYFGKIAQKHIDFIICKEDLKPLYAIELDDNSHNGEKRKEADEFKNKLFEQSRVKLIRIKACTEYSKDYIIRNILNTSEKDGHTS